MFGCDSIGAPPPLGFYSDLFCIIVAVMDVGSICLDHFGDMPRFDQCTSGVSQHAAEHLHGSQHVFHPFDNAGNFLPVSLAHILPGASANVHRFVVPSNTSSVNMHQHIVGLPQQLCFSWHSDLSNQRAADCFWRAFRMGSYMGRSCGFRHNPRHQLGYSISADVLRAAESER